MSELDPNGRDRLVVIAKGVVGACPIVGATAAEVIGHLIPAQRIDRIVTFIQLLEKKVSDHESNIEKLKDRLNSEEGVDLLEEGLIQAARSISFERMSRLASLIGNSLTQEMCEYAQARKLLNLYRELTDPEVLWLIFFATRPALGSGFHSELAEKYPDVLKPISREVGIPQEQIDRGAIQDSYKSTLARFGLLEMSGRSYRITSLGRLLARYIDAIR